ncbi:MAG: SUMF1/EgtB/PvdO family nonheme iron enzyme [Candidatus Micrarchaeota archaeon]
MQRHRLSKTASMRKISFVLMPVLAAGLMVSCDDSMKRHPSGPESEMSEGPIKPPQRADSAYTTGFVIGCPDWMVRVFNEPRDYCIDRFEAHLVEIRGGVETVHPSSVSPPPLGRFIAKSLPGVLPQSSVNRKIAENACWNAGKRLCTIREWIRSCSGVHTFIYPYGDREVPGMCNTRKPHILSELHGSNPRAWGDGMNDPLLNMVKGYLAKTGQYTGCVSTYGTYDQVGNLHEWVSDLVDEKIAASRPRLGPAANNPFKSVPGNGIFMGGFFSTANENGSGCSYMTTVHFQEQRDYSIGFRCCKDADAK